MTAELTKKIIERYDCSVPKAQYEIMKIPNSEECYDLFSLSSERVSSFYQTVDSIIKNHSELGYLTWVIDSNDIIIQKNVILGTPSTVLVPYGKDSDNEKKRKNIAQNIDLTIVDYPLMEEWHNLKSELKIDLNFIILFNRWQGLARGIKSTPITNLGGNIIPATKGWLSDIPWLKHFQGISESVCLQREYNPYMSKAGTVALLLENEYPGHARYTILRPLVLALMNITITEHESKFRDYAEIYNWILSLQNCIDSDRNFIDYVEIVYEWKFGVNPKAPPEDYLPEILRPEDIIRACTLKAIPINDLIRISISLGFEENHQKYKSVWETLRGIPGTVYSSIDDTNSHDYYFIMARMARVVIPGVGHHVTQRGNRRQQTFFRDSDYIAYLDYLREGCERAGTRIWAYCLMPNHVHLLLCPSTEDGLRKALAEAHRRYTRLVNFRESWRGHLWQERFASFPADERHTFAAARYIELNPVRAKLAANPEEYPWSSAKAHILRKSSQYVDVEPLLRHEPDWRCFLMRSIDETTLEVMRQHERTGRPLGDATFIANIEDALGRTVAPMKPGPKPKSWGV